MQKVILPLSKCIPGMTTAQPIANLQTGSIIVGQNQVLNSMMIENLQHFIHTEIWVYIDSWNKVWNVPEELVSKFKGYAKEVKDIFNAPNITQEEIKEISEMIRGVEDDFKTNYTLLGCINLIKSQDKTVYNHTINVAFLAMLLGRWMRHDKEKIDQIGVAAMLHDIGKLDLPDYLWDRTENLEEEELADFRKHPIEGNNKLSKIKGIDREVLKAVLSHHERCDGSGYPLRMKGPNISNVTKIVAIADEYDTLRNKYSIFQTLEKMQTEMIEKLDTEMLLTFCRNIANYYVGVYVILNTGDIGEVIFIQPHCVYKPIIRINKQFIDLYEHPEIRIIDIE